MGTEILKSFGVLQSELEQAKTSLKGVDENIKRLIGRDPSELIPRPGLKRNLNNEENNRGRQRNLNSTRVRNFNHENDEPMNKRRPSVFKRLSERPSHYEEEILQQPQKQLISKVIVTPKEVPSRQDALAAQSTDEKSKARNRRMFGALLGTLQKFQQEETKLKSKEQKRAQVEKKIEEDEIREKAEIKKERQELFFNRKQKQAEIKMIELKMTRMREYAAWEERQKPRSNFILTKTKPHIYYLPRRINEPTKALLEKSKSDVEKIIEKRKLEVSTELQHIEDRMKKNFEQRMNKGVHPENETVTQDEHEAETDLKEVVTNELNSCIDHAINENSNLSENGEISNFVESTEAVINDKNVANELEVPEKMEVDSDNVEVQNPELEEIIDPNGIYISIYYAVVH
ncbi:hypothetical protein RN001_000635 [Aquatica leii]|uniref:Pinin n=1 Tax=Aquatica leii TaxID=1421715 RepID=A0AAN7PF65_9COLE|nr:hypothetical protein RN001_000635 [Aquatica leii]